MISEVLISGVQYVAPTGRARAKVPEGWASFGEGLGALGHENVRKL